MRGRDDDAESHGLFILRVFTCGKGRTAYLWSSTHKITREREDAPSTIAFALGLAGACVDGMGAASVAFF